MKAGRGAAICLTATVFALGAALIAPPLLAQDQDALSVTDAGTRPQPKPDAPVDADRPPETPADTVTEDEAAPEAAPRGDDAAPVDATPAPTDKPEPPPAEGADAPAEPVGALIPPEPEDAAARETDPPALPPPGPPMHQTLRESDTDYAACLLALSHLGMRYAEMPPVTDPESRDCGIARPIRVDEVLPGVTLDGGALMRCGTARALGFWTRDFVRPAAALLPGAPRLAGLTPGTTYDCRGRVGTGADAPKLSEHAYGNAVDIAAFRLDNGDVLPVAPRQDSGNLPEAFQRAVRGAACLWFTTVLGPGSNAAHDDHLHLDIIDRGDSDWRLCQ